MAQLPRSGASNLLKTLERGLRGADIDSYHHQRLIDIARYARGATRYYKTGLDQFLSSDRFDIDGWRQIPILTREAVRDRHDDLLVMPQKMPPDAGPIRSSITSGTSGQPLEFRLNRLADIFSQIKYRAYFRDWDISVGKPVLTARNPKKHEQSLAGQIVKKRQPGGGEEQTIFSLAIDNVLQAAAAIRPSYLRTYPSVAFQCAAEARRRQLSLSFEKIMTVGETLDPETQAFIEQTFSCRVADAYATTEFGLVAYGCPKCGNYHLSHEGLFVELLTDAGDAVRPGDAGRVVVTGLYGYAMPLIRYELSDYATRSAVKDMCRDRGLTIGRIMGRRRSMFKLPSGGLIWPHVPPIAMHELAVTGYRVTQTELREIRVDYTGPAEVSSDAVTSLIHQYLSPNFRVTVARTAELNTSPSGKQQVFESLV